MGGHPLLMIIYGRKRSLGGSQVKMPDGIDQLWVVEVTDLPGFLTPLQASSSAISIGF
jgi:hypothetical protein